MIGSRRNAVSVWARAYVCVVRTLRITKSENLGSCLGGGGDFSPPLNVQAVSGAN